jgi:hydroxymethylglutaryl-CoA lyase
LSSIEVSLSASNTHSQKNAGMSRYDALEQAKAMIRRAKMHGLTVRTSVQCAVGCVFEGTIDRKVVAVMAQDLMEAGADSLALADTTGMGHPGSIRALLEEIEKKLPQLPIALHLHDTLGLGLVNLMTGLECGVRCFDTSCGGLGGCPFVPGAAGNIATEDTVYFLHTLGYTTGVDWSKTAFCTQELEQILGRRLPAKLRQNVFKSLS